MAIVTLRIPDDVRKRMAKVKINWSEQLRQAISEVLESDTKSSLLRKVVALRSQAHASRGTAARILRTIRDHV